MRGLLAQRGASGDELAAHDHELARVRAVLAERILEPPAAALGDAALS